MSERPPNKSEQTPDQPEFTGGWRTPQSSAGWRTPEKPAEPQGWRTITTLPADLEPEPEIEGTWHLPRPEDTIYEQGDEATAPATEQTVVVETGATGSQPAAPEDVSLYLAAEKANTELPRVDDDEDEPFSMSELVALASLVQNDSTSDALSDTAPLIGTIPLSTGQQTTIKDAASLSPAERAMMGITADTLSAEEYARRQLEMLDNPDAASSVVVSATNAAVGDAALTPEEYARRQLEQLGGTMSESPIAPAAVSAISSAEQEIATKFRDTQDQVRVLRRQYQSGQLSREDLENRLRQLMILDNDQVWWMMGVETDTWYRFENNEWVADTPSLLKQPTGAISPITGASMAYLSEPLQPPTEYSTSAPTIPDEGGLRVDENFMPLPRQVPRQDPEATVPAAVGVYLRDVDPNLTQPASGIPASQPTVAMTPITGEPYAGNVGAYIESPYDAAALAPAVEEPVDSETEFESAKKRQQRSTLNTLVIAALVSVGFVFLIGIGITLFIVIQYNQIASEWRDEIENLQAYVPQFQTARILDAEGNVIAELNSENAGARTILTSLDQVSPYMLHAIVSLENERFYEDPGWDLIAILRAFWANFTAGEIEQGASTITQQIARNLLLEDTSPTAQRKLEEIIIAGEIARLYDKNFILLLYLNEFYFGNQSYGVEEAADFYFGQNAATLDLAQSAFLAGLIQSPALYDPVTNPTAAFNRMYQVIDQMVAVGCLTFQHAQWAPGGPQEGDPFCVDTSQVRLGPDGRVVGGPAIVQTAQVEAQAYEPRSSGVEYPHFVQFVQAQLERDFGTAEIFRRGFTVRTTLIPRIQDGAQDALSSQMAALSNTGINTGSVLVIDPSTGAILAMIGSPDFNNVEIGGQNNYSLSWEQPGSSIKPIVYTAALSGNDVNGNGTLESNEYYTPATILWDVPTTFAGGYAPTNFDRQFRGPVALRFSLGNSLNVPSVKVYEFVGNERFIEVSTSMGLNYLPQAVFGLPTGIGATEVRLYDMVHAYGTLANGGVNVPMYAIESVTDAAGNVVTLPARPQPQQVIRPDIAYLMQNIMSDDGARSQQFGTNSVLTIPGLPTQNTVAVKTGTTDGNRDLWTIGFTRNFVVGVWVGRGDNQVTQGASFTAAAPLWNQVMQIALNGQAPPQFAPPSNGSVVAQQICADTGALPADNCSSIRNEIFSVSQPPPPPDQGFVQILAVNTWTGLRANQFCSDNVIQGTFASINDAAAVQWINTTAQGQAFAQRINLPIPLQPAPTAACDLNTVLPIVRMTQPVDGQTLQGQLQITGMATAQNFNRYQLSYAPVGTENFTPIGGAVTTQQTGQNSVLGTWNTVGIADGEYTVRLEVISNEGGFARVDARVRVDNPEPTPTPTVPPPPPTAPVFATPLPFDPLGTPIQGQSFGAPTPTATINFGG